LEQGDITVFVGTNHFGRQLLAIGQLDDNAAGAADYMAIGQDITVIGDDEAGAERWLRREMWQLSRLILTEEASQPIMWCCAFGVFRVAIRRHGQRTYVDN